MEKIKSFLIDALIVVWFLVAIFVTICLLSYNDFGVTVFGKNTLLIIDSDELEPDFMEGDLVVIKRNSDNKIDIGDDVFYYNSAMDSQVLVYHGKVQDKEDVTKSETTFVIDGSKVSGTYVIGKMDNSKVYHNFGKILGVFTSKWGFMFLIIFPTLFAIVYEIMMIVDLSKEDSGKELQNEKDSVDS